MKHLRVALCLFVAGLPAVPCAAQTDGAALVAQLKAFRFGRDRSVLDAVAAWVSASRGDASHRAEAARGLASVLDSDAAFDAKQFALRQIVFVEGEEQIPLLIGLLKDPQLAHYAVMALARIPGDAASSALRVQGLSTAASPAVQADVVLALGQRGDASALSAILPLMRSDDPVLAAAAAAAVGLIGQPRGLRALESLYATVPEDRRAPVGDALLAAAKAQMRAGHSAEATISYNELDRSGDPEMRAAALRGLVQAQPDRAAALILAALGDENTPRQKMAAKLAREQQGTSLAKPLSAGLAKLSPHAQLLLLDALAERGDAAAAPAVAQLARTASGDTRAAALHALGSLGDVSSVDTLLSVASSGKGADRDAARASLVSLRGTAVDKKLMTEIDAKDPVVAAEAISALGERGVAGTTARIMQAAARPQRPVRAAAFRVLRQSAGPAELPALVGLLLATPAGQRDEASAAVSEVARRGETDAQRTGAIVQALSQAKSTADRADLLSLLGEVGGPAALGQLRRASADPAPEVKLAALKALAEWPTDEPLNDLRAAIRAASDSGQRAVALRGYLRLLSINETRPAADSLALYRGVAALARSTAERRLLLAGLAKVRSLAALQYAAGFTREEAVRGEAELAVTEIARSTAGAYPENTRAILAPIASGGGAEARKRAAATLALMEKYGDFLTAWEVSPQYQQQGADYTRLFDTPFPPEQQGGKAAWSLMPAGTPDQPWLLDLLALYPGEQKVAYLRTAIWSDGPRDVVLEAGSDDGIKVWCNGQVVLSHNTARAVAPGQEKATLHLKPGWNSVMLKVTQNIMGWGAVARLTNPDGSPATGVRTGIPSALTASR